MNALKCTLWRQTAYFVREWEQAQKTRDFTLANFIKSERKCYPQLKKMYILSVRNVKIILFRHAWLQDKYKLCFLKFDRIIYSTWLSLNLCITMQSFKTKCTNFLAKKKKKRRGLVICTMRFQCIIHHAKQTYRAWSWTRSWPFLLFLTFFWLLGTRMTMATCFLIFMLIFL
jgi:hypothetical protein